MKAILLTFLGALLLFSLSGAPAFAQTPVTCEQEYTVTAGDWLSKLAEKFYGSVTAYHALATRTNLKSETDAAFATITNPDSIQVGWKLCVPDKETASVLNGDSPPPGLNKTALGNATYSSELVPEGKATLKNGGFSVPAAPDAPLQAQMTLTDQIAYGDLNGVPSAAVITGSTGGGSGYFYILSLIQVRDGKPVEVAVTGIGDRSPVLALAIENNQVVADYLTQGPDQPFCCGTLRVVETYGLEGDMLNATSKKRLAISDLTAKLLGQSLAVTGEVFYRERIAMPEGAVVKVRVSDVSRADVPAEIIGELIIENPGNVPVKFSVGYDQSKIEPRNTYAVSARIEVNGQLMWINTTHIPVITNGNPTSGVQVLVERVPAP